MNKLMRTFLEFNDQDGYTKWDMLVDFLAELNTQLSSYDAWVLVQKLLSTQELKEYMAPYIDIEI